MNQKSGKKWLYIILIIIIAIILWTISQEIPFTPETVQQPIENTFAK